MNRSAQPETGQMSRLQKTSWRHIWSISWPIFLANITVPLVGAVDTAMMGRFPDPAYLGGVALGTLVFNFLYFGGRGEANAGKIMHHLAGGQLPLPLTHFPKL